MSQQIWECKNCGYLKFPEWIPATPSQKCALLNSGVEFTRITCPECQKAEAHNKARGGR